MPKFSERSLSHLSTCHPDIQRILNAVILFFDFTVLVGHRDKEAQNEAFATGRSGKQYPNSKHNALPSIAVDIAPWPIDWKDRERFTYLAGHIKQAANELGLKVRWGGDWDQDTQVNDNNFDDLVHFEIVFARKRFC